MSADRDDAPDGGYVHEPGSVDDDASADAASDDPGAPARPPEDREFGWRGWVVVATVFFAFVVVPAVVIVNPLVVPYRASLLALPMLPAILLGLVAVWATTRQ